MTHPTGDGSAGAFALAPPRRRERERDPGPADASPAARSAADAFETALLLLKADVVHLCLDATTGLQAEALFPAEALLLNLGLLRAAATRRLAREPTTPPGPPRPVRADSPPPPPPPPPHAATLFAPPSPILRSASAFSNASDEADWLLVKGGELPFAGLGDSPATSPSHARAHRPPFPPP